MTYVFRYKDGRVVQRDVDETWDTLCSPIILDGEDPCSPVWIRIEKARVGAFVLVEYEEV